MVARARDLLHGMIGGNGVALPAGVLDRLGGLAPRLQAIGVVGEAWSATPFKTLAVAIPILLTVALACPNTLQILARYEPALGVKVRAGADGAAATRFAWAPSLPWAIAMSG